MKKQLKRVVSVFLAAILCCSVYAVNIQAAPAKGYVKSVTMKSKATIVIPADKKTITQSYKVTVKVKGTVSKKITAKSGNQAVATVKVKGNQLLVTAKKDGKAKIIVTTRGKNKKGKQVKKTLTVTVKKEAKPVEPDPDQPDKREGTIASEMVKWYQYNSQSLNSIESEENPVYFSTAYPDVPFVSDSFAVNYFLKAYQYDPNCEVVKAGTGLSHTYNLPMGTSLNFDYDSKTMCFSDYTSTLVLNGDFMIFNPFSAAARKVTNLYKVSDEDQYYGGNPILATFSYDEVPMLRSGDEIKL